jgi:hypothetical protein
VQIDLTNATFDEFVRFWFDHEIDPRAVGPRADPAYAWYGQGVQIVFDPIRYAESFVELLSHPDRLRAFTPSQLEEGFWAMWSPLVTGALPRAVIWSAKVPWTLRERVIRSMVDVFKGLFATEPLETASYMWWDMIAFPLEDPVASDATEFPDAPRVHAAMFDVVCEILQIEAEPCQRAALHGLNHLRHPAAPRVIREWLDAHPSADPKLAAYADACARFAAP